MIPLTVGDQRYTHRGASDLGDRIILNRFPEKVG